MRDEHAVGLHEVTVERSGNVMHSAVIQIAIPKGVHFIAMYCIHMSIAMYEHTTDVKCARKWNLLLHFQSKGIKFRNINTEYLEYIKNARYK